MNHDCHYFNESLCLSCTGLSYGLDRWRSQSIKDIESLIPSSKWLLPTYSSKAFGSRNKAKFAVGGTTEAPKLGRFTSSGEVIELKDCSLYCDSIRSIVATLYEWISTYKLAPYNVSTKSGELKAIIVVEGEHDSLMIRFVVRSKESLDRLMKLAKSHQQLKADDVISVNFQPETKAILEGESEIVLSSTETLSLNYNGRRLRLPVQSFVQTNHEVASKLYDKAREWTESIKGNVLELFCGIGGFSSHLVQEDRKVVGVELSSSAIEAARSTIADAVFIAMDAWDYLKTSETFDLIVVNPPRRGLGRDICHKINGLKPKYLLYSSCNPNTLANDLKILDYEISCIQAFEMFPLTDHWEILVLLTLRAQ